MAFALSSGQEHKSAEYCASKTDGNIKWYLPALGELNDLYNKIDVTQNTLSAIPNATQISLSSTYWSSNEVAAYKTFRISFKNGAVDQAYKSYAQNLARCFGSF